MKHDYHDATLKALTAFWEAGTVELIFRLSTEVSADMTIRVSGASEIRWARAFPWGRSVSVNSLEVQEVPSGYRLEVEMQSGDRISIVGKEILEAE